MVPVLGLMLAGMGGALIGALSRQPEINNLKKQVRDLQNEVKRLQATIDMQNTQINTLMVRYKALKAYQFKEKSETRSYMRGALIFQYAYKDYLELLMSSAGSTKDNMSETEVVFYNIFDKVIEGRNVSPPEKNAIKEYILSKYKIQIDNLVPCDCQNTLERLKKYSA